MGEWNVDLAPTETIEQLQGTVTASEVSEIYGLADQTIRAHIKQGKVIARRSGNVWIMRRADAHQAFKDVKARNRTSKSVGQS